MKTLRLTKALVLFIILFFGTASVVSAENFVHPGLSHKKSDLDRMKYMVEAKIDPWYTSYKNMCELNTAQYTYTVLGDVSITDYGIDRGWKDPWFNDDARAAYYGALRWYIEGDERYAEKAIEAIMAWTGLTNTPDMSLQTAPIWLMIEAAELIKHTYDGWAPEDQKKFEDMLVYPGYSTTKAATGNKTWYWNAHKFDQARAGNQELCGVRTVTAIGVFLDNDTIYDRGMRYVSNLPAREYDLPYEVGPRIQGPENVDGSTEFSISYDIPYPENTGDSANWGYCGVLPYNIYPNGQNVESSRDQGHTSFSLGLLSTLGEIGWNQGYDFFGLLDSRVLKGLEYSLRYSVSSQKSFPDQPTPWQPTTFIDREGYEEPLPSDSAYDFIQLVNRTKRNKSQNISSDAITSFITTYTWELPIAHYVGRGLKTEDDLKWTIRARDYAREVNGTYEVASTGQDYTGYGALSYYRVDGCMGDPISGFDGVLPVYDMNILPCTIEAENYDYNPINAEGRIYHDVDASNTSGEYRDDQGVDIASCSEGGYQLTSLEDGEWLTYTVAVPAAGYYDIKLRYAAANGDGKIQFDFSGEDKTGEVTIPFGEGYSTGISSYADFSVASKVLLQAGVQAMKVNISGASNSFVLNNITLEANTSAFHIEAENYSEMNGVLIDSTLDIEGLLQVESLDNGDWLAYDINLPYTQNYNFEFRLASAISGEYTVMLDDVLIENVAYTATGGSDVWESQMSEISYPLLAGKHTLKIIANTSGSQLNWIDLTSDESTCDETEVIPYFSIYNSGGVELTTLQADSIAVIPGYRLHLSLDPEFGGTWNWTGPNGFSSTDRDVEFDDIQTSDAGEYIVEYINDCGTSTFKYINIEVSDFVLIEAEAYSNMSGVDFETTTDQGAGENAFDITADDWLEYEVNIPYTGNYIFDYRVAGIAAGNFTISSDNIDLETVSFEATGDEQSWTTVSSSTAIYLTEGVQTLRIKANSAEWKLNWLQLNLQDVVMPCSLPFVFDELSMTSQVTEWSSGVLDISCEDSVNLFMDIQSNEGVGEGEMITVSYKVDGGSEVILATHTGALDLVKWYALALNGQTLELIVRGTINAEVSYTLHNIRVSATPDYDKLEAESFDLMAGIETQGTSDSGGGEQVAFVHNTDWIMFQNVDLTGAKSLYARYTCPTDASAIEARLGAEDGELIATLALTNTGGWNGWTTVGANIQDTVGLHDVYFIFTGGDGYLFNLNWMQFSSEIILSTESLLTSSVYTVDQDDKMILNVPLGALVSTFESNLSLSEGATVTTYRADGVTEATEIEDESVVVVIAEDGLHKTTYTVEYLSSEAIATSDTYTVDQVNLTIVGVDDGTATALVKYYLDFSEGATAEGYEADGVTEASKIYEGYKIVVTSEDETNSTVYTIGVAAGIDETNIDGLLLYPNPVNDILTIENQSGGNIEIYNQLGKNMTSRALDAQQVMIPMDNYEPGMYIVKISSDNKVAFFRVMKL